MWNPFIHKTLIYIWFMSRTPDSLQLLIRGSASAELHFFPQPIFRIIRDIVWKTSSHDARTSQCKCHPGGVYSDPSPPPPLSCVCSCAGAACGINYQVAWICRHQHAPLDNGARSLNYIRLIRGRKCIRPNIGNHLTWRIIIKVSPSKTRSKRMQAASAIQASHALLICFPTFSLGNGEWRTPLNFIVVFTCWPVAR